MDENVIREYLVKLGIELPIQEIQKFNAHMESLDKGIFGLVKKINSFFSGWKAAISVYAGAAKGIYGFAQSVAKADLEVQKLAKRMFLTDDSAKTLTRTLDAMGLQFDDLQDVALNPELLSQYRELVSLGKTLSGGPEVSKSLRDIREVGFEFTKMKMTLSYIKERIVYYIAQILQSPTGRSFVESIKSLNSFLVNNFDSIARKIATVLQVILRTISRVGQVIKFIFNIIKSIYQAAKNYIGDLAKAITAAFAIVSIALMAGPFGRLLMLFQGIMLVLDDYLTYKEGGKYLIPWEKTQELKRAAGFETEPTPEEKEQGVVYKPGLVESIFRLPVEGLGKLILPKEDIERMERQYPSYFQTSSNDSKQKPIILSFNGSNFTREDIERGARGSDKVEVRFNQGVFV